MHNFFCPRCGNSVALRAGCHDLGFPWKQWSHSFWKSPPWISPYLKALKQKEKTEIKAMSQLCGKFASLHTVDANLESLGISELQGRSSSAFGPDERWGAFVGIADQLFDSWELGNLVTCCFWEWDEHYQNLDEFGKTRYPTISVPDPFQTSRFQSFWLQNCVASGESLGVSLIVALRAENIL